MNVKIYREADYEAMSRRGADIIAAQLAEKPCSVLGLATGSTPVGIYRLLADKYERGEISFARTVTINLDEYAGLPAAHPRSYRFFMEKQLFEHIDVRRETTFIPDGTAADLAAECRRYDGVVEKYGPIDLQLLGLGHNGHIGFNEPGEALVPGTHVVTLTESTVAANARFFTAGEEVPRRAVTLGMRAIMGAGRVVLAVSGRDKAEITARAFSGPVTTQVPASLLQLHPDVTLIGDGEALSLLLEKEALSCS